MVPGSREMRLHSCVELVDTQSTADSRAQTHHLSRLAFTCQSALHSHPTLIAIATCVDHCQKQIIMSLSLDMIQNISDSELIQDSLDSELIQYAKKGNLDMVLDLLHRGTNVNAKDNLLGKTALMCASENGNLEVVRALLDHEGVNVNVRCNSGHTALMYASAFGHVAVVHALLNHDGVAVNAESNYDGTALIVASRCGRLEVVRALSLHDGVAVNVKDEHGYTALIAASEKGHLEVVRALLNHEEVDVNAKNKLDRTALDLAIKEKKDDVARLLIEFLRRNRDERDSKKGVQKVEDKIKKTMSDVSHKSIKHSNAFPNAVRRLVKSCVPCLRPCTGIKLLELIDHRRVGRYGPLRKRVLDTVQGNDETLITYVDDNHREPLENLVKTPSEQYILASDVTQSVGFTSAFHAEFPLQEADLARVGLKATSDKSWSLYFNDGRITKKSVSEVELRTFLDRNDIQKLRFMNSKTGVVIVMYSVTGGLTYVGDSRLVTTGGKALDPTPTGPVEIMAGWQYTVTNSGQVVLSETNPVEWMIGIEFLEFGATQKRRRN